MKPTILSRKRWLLPLLGGFFLPIILWGCLHLIYPPIDPKVVAAAQRLNIDPRVYNDVSEMFVKAEKSHNLPERDWMRLKQYLSDPNVNLQHEVLDVFSQMRRSPHRTEIQEIGRKYVNGSQKELRLEALIVLWKFNDSTWRNEATKMASTRDAEDRVIITHMLEKGDRHQ